MKNFLLMICASLFCSMCIGVNAFASDHTEMVASDESVSECDLSNDAIYNISSSENRIAEPQINRDATVNCYGDWAYIFGDNNVVGETVKVTNVTSRPILIEAYTQNGTLRGSATLAYGETKSFGFWIADGTYYFKVKFANGGTGLITIHMQTQWLY